MSNGVLCSKCNNKVMPRLWQNNMNSLTHERSNQHICPICGITMYTTGGEITFIGKLTFLLGFPFIVFIVSIFALYFVDITGSSRLNWSIVLGSVTFFCCLYKLYLDSSGY